MLLDHIVQAGPVALVLLALSVVTFGVVLERCWVQLAYPRFDDRGCQACRELLATTVFDRLEQKLHGESRGWRGAIALLVANRGVETELREGLLSHWLEVQRRHLNAHLKILGLIGMLAPLLGLLGTVFGIIDMFRAIAHHSGPVTPSLLAEGMWTAMVTTALGLLIAIPALSACHGLEQLSQARLARIQDALNELNFILMKGQTTVAGRGLPAEEAVAPATAINSLPLEMAL